MDFAIEFGGDPQDLTITIAGSADLAGLNLVERKVVSDPRFRPGMAILVDISELDATGMAPPDVEGARELMLEHDWTFPPRAEAIVVSSQDMFEQANEAVADGRVLGSHRQVFLSRDDAIAWLREEKARDS